MSTLDTLLNNITTFRRNYSGVFAWCTEATAEIDSLNAEVAALEARVTALEAGTPAPDPSPPYTTTNVTADRSLDANKTTIDELADVVGTVIGDLKAGGVFQ